MTTIQLLAVLEFAQILLCIAALGLILYKKQWRDYWALGSFLAVSALSGSVLHS